MIFGTSSAVIPFECGFILFFFFFLYFVVIEDNRLSKLCAPFFFIYFFDHTAECAPSNPHHCVVIFSTYLWKLLTKPTQRLYTEPEASQLLPSHTPFMYPTAV